jgi:hypothetical protein
MAGSAKSNTKMNLLMAIPRNLVYIFICAIFGAFVGMAYIVYYDIDINQFKVNFNFSNVDAKVHPVFKHL